MKKTWFSRLTYVLLFELTKKKMVLFYNKGEPDHVYKNEFIKCLKNDTHTYTMHVWKHIRNSNSRKKNDYNTPHRLLNSIIFLKYIFWVQCSGGDILNTKQISKLDTHHLPKPVLLLFFFSGNIFVFQIHFLTPQLFTRSLLDNAPNYVVNWVRYPKEIYRWCNLLGWTRS